MEKKTSEVRLELIKSVEELRNFFNRSDVRHFFRLGFEVADAVTTYASKPTKFNAMKAIFQIGKAIVDDVTVWPDEYFDEVWESPYPRDFTRLVVDVLSHKPHKIIKTADERTVIHIIDIDDVKFGYVKNMKTNFVERVYVEADKIPEAKEVIKRELWRKMKDENIVLQHSRNLRGNDGETFSIEKDCAFRPMPSKRAEEYTGYLRKCVAAGVTRSVMLYGPPGTGKSTMARTIIHSLGMKSLRIRVEDIEKIDTATVFEAINLFEPDAVILDDFDRSNSQVKLLEILEYFQRHVKIVIATVNSKNRLDEAIVRPGRFDELMQVKQMDDDVIRAVLGEKYADSLDLVRGWPIAFIHEYIKRRTYMSSSEAEESMKELASRVKRLSMHDEEDEELNLIDNVIDGPAKTRLTD
jgi:ATPase family associated with various cellular activities (AAA)